MRSLSREEIDINEEKKANKLFIILFYFIYIFFEVYRNFIRPLLDIAGEEIIFRSQTMMATTIVFYIVITSLLPISVWLTRNKRPFSIKYLYFSVFFLGILVTEILRYYGNSDTYASGSPVELFFVLFAPIYVNRVYYLVVAIGFVCKYSFMGFFTLSPEVTFPIVLLVLFSTVTFIILNRFKTYLRTVEKSYERAGHNEKLAFIGQIATSVTHEIKNPLTSLKGFVQLQELEQHYNPKYSQIMLQELERLNIIVNDLMVLGKPQALKLKSVELINCLSYVINLVQQQADNNHITICFDYDEKQIYISGEDVRLKQVFLNVLKNAMEAMPDGGEIKVKVRQEEKWTTVQIVDRGIGIPEEEIPNLEKAFYSTKENGTGLGLMVSYQIVEEHRGRIDVESEIDIGTTFSVHFPTPKIM
ncbi:ATP-binding protein [Pseudalkalibacillus hwajinpoensis]|uniref:ATP-binding protein n=1 Tax=Guptibacillus hwajinpoensis TaxID=208199 RepID=UPI00325B89BF